MDKPRPPVMYYSRFHECYFVMDEMTGKYLPVWVSPEKYVEPDELPDDVVELIPSYEADEVFHSSMQLEMELCEILGIEWLLTNWGDIQVKVREIQEKASNYDALSK